MTNVIILLTARAFFNREIFNSDFITYNTRTVYGFNTKDKLVSMHDGHYLSIPKMKTNSVVLSKLLYLFDTCSIDILIIVFIFVNWLCSKAVNIVFNIYYTQYLILPKFNLLNILFYVIFINLFYSFCSFHPNIRAGYVSQFLHT